MLRRRRHVPEAEEPLPLLRDDPLQRSLAVAALLEAVLEERAHPVGTSGRELDAKPLALAAEEGVGDLGQYPAPSPVSGSLPLVPRCSRLRSTSSPSSTVSRVRRPSTRHEPQATAVVLVEGVVKAGHARSKGCLL